MGGVCSNTVWKSVWMLSEQTPVCLGFAKADGDDRETAESHFSQDVLQDEGSTTLRMQDAGAQ